MILQLLRCGCLISEVVTLEKLGHYVDGRFHFSAEIEEVKLLGLCYNLELNKKMYQAIGTFLDLEKQTEAQFILHLFTL